MRILIAILFVLVHFCIFSQKAEHEIRVESTEVPLKAREWLNKVEIYRKHPKWFEETTSGKKSFEIKFVHDHQLYSIEFDSIGNIEDVEILKKKKDLAKAVQEEIQKELQAKYDKIKFVKIQFQFSNASGKNALLDFVNGQAMENIELNYEIEFEGKVDGVWKMNEGKFTDQGTLISTREIVIRSTENLNY